MFLILGLLQGEHRALGLGQAGVHLADPQVAQRLLRSKSVDSESSSQPGPGVSQGYEMRGSKLGIGAQAKSSMFPFARVPCWAPTAIWGQEVWANGCLKTVLRASGQIFDHSQQPLVATPKTSRCRWQHGSKFADWAKRKAPRGLLALGQKTDFPGLKAPAP